MAESQYAGLGSWEIVDIPTNEFNIGIWWWEWIKLGVPVKQVEGESEITPTKRRRSNAAAKQPLRQLAHYSAEVPRQRPDGDERARH